MNNCWIVGGRNQELVGNEPAGTWSWEDHFKIDLNPQVYYLILFPSTYLHKINSEITKQMP
jgi:hypothetical protein